MRGFYISSTMLQPVGVDPRWGRTATGWPLRRCRGSPASCPRGWLVKCWAIAGFNNYRYDYYDWCITVYRFITIYSYDWPVNWCITILYSYSYMVNMIGVYNCIICNTVIS